MTKHGLLLCVKWLYVGECLTTPALYYFLIKMLIIFLNFYLYFREIAGNGSFSAITETPKRNVIDTNIFHTGIDV